MTSPYLTTEEAAAYLGLSVKRVIELVSERQLTPYGRIGRRGAYRWRTVDLDEWLKGCITADLDRSSAVPVQVESLRQAIGYEEDEESRARDLPDERRPLPSPERGQMPRDRKNCEKRSDCPDTTGGKKCKAENQGRDCIPASGKRSADYYRERLRRAVVGK